MAACDFVPYIRDISDLSSSDVSDNMLEALAAYAWNDVMYSVGKREQLEKVTTIDKYRENDINGDNTTFYTRASYMRYSGDWDGDMDLDTDDIEVWLFDSTNDTRTQATVSSYSSDGKFVLDSAPAATYDGDMYINYTHLPVSMDSPLDPMLRDAVAFKTTSLAYGKLDPKDYDSISFRGMSIKSRAPMKLGGAFDSWDAKANQKIYQLNCLQNIIRVDDIKREYALRLKNKPWQKSTRG